MASTNALTTTFNDTVRRARNFDWRAVRWRDLAPGSDVGLAMAVVGLLSVLILPLPTFLLDVGLALSVTSSVLVLMVALFLKSPRDFTSFPTLLLLTTLLRLSLEVATTRLILSHGNEGRLAAGHVVAAFGGFLMGGDVVIGGIVFAILLVVNFMVITKGSGRIAEVAARFSLDAMPGKQMAIDAELSSGAITDKAARVRRRELEEESGFYGAMDGAAKFVRGDAIASLLITGINIIGGLAIGLGRYGMPLTDAASTFTTLTVGDGLVAQVPALLVSTAAGIVVTKGGTEGAADEALVRQLGGNAKPLAMCACAAFLLALMPGLPMLPFLGLGGLAAAAAVVRHRRPLSEDGVDVIATQPVTGSVEPPLSAAMHIDLLRLELGFNLLPLAAGESPRLTEQIKVLRRTIAGEMGFILPPVRIQDNLQLAPDQYVLRIKEIEVGSGEVKLNRLLVMDPKGGLPDVKGDETSDPAFGLKSKWIEPELREEALFHGYTVVDPASVVTTHLTELIRENMAELMPYTETQKLLDELPRDQQRLVADLVPSQISVGGVQRVLQSLLAERVSIRDLPTILESIQEGCGLGLKAMPLLVAHVRSRLARQISNSLVGPNGYIPLVTLSPEWEGTLLEAMVGPPEDRHLALAPGKLNDFVAKLRQALDAVSAQGDVPVLLVSSSLRGPVRAIMERLKPSVPVLAQGEIAPRARIKTLRTLT
ncbi:flagellar biosynthesis protein FlhA [Ameyamaea chiangmaiensis NBRC 103196]|uniref:Flagellar biosynthesis protein FlhA n=1 Tax=Ameyamaea chiangmaiensis TaxID=442969 RepID=A0A850PCX3_9PROT|nr:flagellar biosynthesis protein FlhA [Ameyamaea chiangmaiensis]MBS4074749.1 flagellar biosynthesis protein FlhA [Ameyamaea chiangmaiensis]NVN40136.1 flagellar biosynthesis protein FlhA [Ameyamaea chiangmaiensis]GBQ62607.1 flagellar biosynthesis protein FlhA [Ameyamaea chiangmaiensis NBRC 103196]